MITNLTTKSSGLRSVAGAPNFRAFILPETKNKIQPIQDVPYRENQTNLFYQKSNSRKQTG